MSSCGDLGSDATRLALFLPALHDGGAEQVMLTLGRSIAARGHVVDLVVGVSSGPLTQSVPQGLRVVHLGARRTIVSLPALVRYLRRARPTTLLSTLEHGNILSVTAGFLSRTGVRVVVREAAPVLPASQIVGGKHRLQRALQKCLYPWASMAIGVSQGVSDGLVRELGLPPHKVRTIYNPIIPADLAARAAAPVDDPWFAPGAPPVVLAAGRLAPEKDFGTLLRAFTRVREQRRARLVILGEGRERASLEALARELGISSDCRLPGFESNPFRYMQRCAVFALSSLFDGLPGALILAMACGCHVVATDCPGGVREILQDGALGRLVPVRNPEALAYALVTLLDVAARGPARVRHPVERFTEESTVTEYLQALGVAQRRPASRQGTVPSRGNPGPIR
jgi:glycosyltransferase involved in cell wall biosynthesis